MTQNPAAAVQLEGRLSDYKDVKKHDTTLFINRGGERDMCISEGKSVH